MGQLPHLRKPFSWTAGHEAAVVGLVMGPKQPDGSRFERHILTLPAELERRPELYQRDHSRGGVACRIDETIKKIAFNRLRRHHGDRRRQAGLECCRDLREPPSGYADWQNGH